MRRPCHRFERLAQLGNRLTEYISQHKAEAALLHELYGSAAPDEGMDALAGHLAHDLRAGRFDARLEAVGDLLLAEVTARLRVSNPKYLKQAGLN